MTRSRTRMPRSRISSRPSRASPAEFRSTAHRQKIVRLPSSCQKAWEPSHATLDERPQGRTEDPTKRSVSICCELTIRRHSSGSPAAGIWTQRLGLSVGKMTFTWDDAWANASLFPHGLAVGICELKKKLCQRGAGHAMQPKAHQCNGDAGEPCAAGYAVDEEAIAGAQVRPS